MRKNGELYLCRICGFEQPVAPWGEDGESATWGICDCCGTEFGYEDGTLESIRANREKWLENGALWWRKKCRPENWSLEAQLANIPKKYL